MIPLDRYPKEITLRDDARVILRPMLPGDTDALWSFLRQLPEIDKSHFHEDVDRREVVERWANIARLRCGAPDSGDPWGPCRGDRDALP